MIFKNTEKEVEIVGDIKSNKIDIKQEDIAHLKRVLSSQNYSYPIESTIRETVSNAWDTSQDVKDSDPIIIELGKEENQYYVRIQDFGTGISEELFEKVYLGLGGSTKRNNAKAIGGYGIGRFAPLSYTNSLYMTTRYEGQERQYMMIKDGLDIDVPLIQTLPTDKKNGTEFKIFLHSSEDIETFRSSIKNLVYFGNIYVRDNIQKGFSIEESFSNYKIKEYNNFMVENLTKTPNVKLLIGKVLYPLRKESVDSNRNFNLPIALKFKIGEIEVLPNREEIVYSNNTIEAINKKLEAAEKEIQEILKIELCKDFTNFEDYLKVMTTSSYPFCLIENGVALNNINTYEKYTYKNKYYTKKFLLEYNRLASTYLNFVCTRFINPTSIKAKKYIQNCFSENFSSFEQNILTTTKKILRCDFNNLTAASKAYLRDHKSGQDLIEITSNEQNNSVKNFIFNLKKRFLSTGLWGSPNITHFDKDLAREFRDFYLETYEKIPIFTNKSVPQSYLDNRKNSFLLNRNTSSVNWKENIKLHEVIKGNNYNSLIFQSDNYSLKECKEATYLYIYSDKADVRLKPLKDLIKNPKIRIVGIAPTKFKLIENFNNFMPIETFLKGNMKIFSRVVTSALLAKEYPQIDTLSVLGNLEKISTKLVDLIKELKIYKDENKPLNFVKNEDLLQEMYDFAEKNNCFDTSILSLLNTNKSLLKNASVLEVFSTKQSYYNPVIEEKNINIAVDYILARKLFRPNVEAVNRLKKETIFNIKEEINEDN